jgi:hypothetical protein
MKFIAHRGNTIGKLTSAENQPYYIDGALRDGFDVELDLWIIDDELFLGHDNADTKIDKEFLIERKDKLWCHGKNLEALDFLVKENFNCFFHDKDDYTLTSKGIIWAYPGQKINKNSVCVMPESCDIDVYTTEDFKNCYGICSDIIEVYRENYSES